MFLQIHRVYFTYPSGEELVGNVWKVTFKTSRQISSLQVEPVVISVTAKVRPHGAVRYPPNNSELQISWRLI